MKSYPRDHAHIKVWSNTLMKEEKRQISHAVEFQIIYIDILPSRKGNLTPYFSSVSWAWFLLPKCMACKVGEDYFTVDEPDEHCIKQVIKVTSTVIKPVDRLCPRYHGMKMTLYLYHSFPKTHNPSLTMRKTSNSSRGAIYNIPDQYSSNLSKSSTSRKTLKNCHRQEKSRDMD